MKEIERTNSEALKELFEIQSAKEWERALLDITESLVFALDTAPPEFVRSALEDVILLQRFFISCQGEKPYNRPTANL